MKKKKKRWTGYVLVLHLKDRWKYKLHGQCLLETLKLSQEDDQAPVLSVSMSTAWRKCMHFKTKIVATRVATVVRSLLDKNRQSDDDSFGPFGSCSVETLASIIRRGETTTGRKEWRQRCIEVIQAETKKIADNYIQVAEEENGSEWWKEFTKLSELMNDFNLYLSITYE